MSTEKKPLPVKLVQIIECKQVYTGTNKQGEEYQIYEVRACSENGEPIEKKLNSFEELPLETLEVTVKPYEKDGTVVSYTLARKMASMKQRVADLEKQVEGLIRVVRRNMGDDGPLK